MPTFTEGAHIQIKMFKGQEDNLQSFCSMPALNMAFRNIPTGQELVLAVNSLIAEAQDSKILSIVQSSPLSSCTSEVSELFYSCIPSLRNDWAWTTNKFIVIHLSSIHIHGQRSNIFFSHPKGSLLHTLQRTHPISETTAVGYWHLEATSAIN